MLAVQAAGQCQWADTSASEPLGIRNSRREMTPCRVHVAAVEVDHGSDSDFAAGRTGFLQVIRYDRDLGQRFVPPTRLEEQLAQSAVRLAAPERRAHLVGEVPRLPGRG